MGKEILALEHISKAYSGNPVLNDITVRLKQGEVVSLVGENGAGKSTLMNILFGMDVIRNTGGFDGRIIYHGQAVEIDSPNKALAMGIGMVHQEFMLMEDYSIAENIKLNKENAKKGIATKPFKGQLDLLDYQAMGNEARKALDRVKLTIDEWLPVAGLPVGTMQFVEIAKTLDNENVQVLIFDEPTAVLTESESRVLLDIIKELTAKGIACLFISHKLEEVLEVSDQIIVLRDGYVVGEFKRGEANALELARLMVGREMSVSEIDVRDKSAEPVVMSIRDLKVQMPGERVEGISLDIYKGEILGICGLAGSGKLGISNGIHGLYKTSGAVIYEGEPLDIKNTKEVLSKKIAFLSEDRKKVGLMLEESIKTNCIMSSSVIRSRFTKRVCGIRMEDKKAAQEAAQQMIQDLHIKCTGPNQPVGDLSGGNQQKVCVAAMLLQEPDMIFASEPSRGVDVGAKKLILDYLKKINREKGITIVVTSSELNELRSICDRIVVIARGKQTGILRADEVSEQFGILMMDAGNIALEGGVEV